MPTATSAVGIDVGIARFAPLSNGVILEPLNSFKRHETALRKAQQAMSRKTRFSSNWKKAKARVQRIHTRIGNARRGFLHKATATISQNHAMVCIEDLRVRNMARSAAGTADKPGKNVRAVLDQGWFEFRRQLDYKLAWQGRVSHHRAAAEHQPHLPVLRAGIGGQPAAASPVCVHRVWFRGKRRSGWCDQGVKGGTRPVRL